MVNLHKFPIPASKIQKNSTFKKKTKKKKKKKKKIKIKLKKIKKKLKKKNLKKHLFLFVYLFIRNLYIRKNFTILKLKKKTTIF